MGGSKTVGKEEAAAQTKKNAAVQRENNRRLEKQARSNNEIRYKSNRKQWDIDKKSYRTKAGMDAQSDVTSERADLIKSSSNLLTDFEAQERTRLMRARKGTGQVRAEDEAITGDNRKEAIRRLNLGEDYWSSRRQVAYDKAYGSSEGQWDKKNALPELELTKDQKDSRQRGRDYKGRGAGNPIVQPAVTATVKGKSLFGGSRSNSSLWGNKASTNQMSAPKKNTINNSSGWFGKSSGNVGINPGKPGIK